MLSEQALRKLALRSVDWLVAIVAGVASAVALRRWGLPIDGAVLPAAMFAAAGVFGTMSGFLSASMIFTATIDNPGIRELRRKHGAELNDTLLGATAALLVTALAVVVCGIAADGWGARAVAVGLTTLSIAKLLRAGFVVRGTLASVVEESRRAGPSTPQTPVP